jgi:hypothetical protein
MDSDKILKKFNLGYLISFDWKSAICPCGTLLNKNDQNLVKELSHLKLNLKSFVKKSIFIITFKIY